MTSIITADIVNSRKDPSGEWLPVLKRHLTGIASEPDEWEFYRGDAFQIEIKTPENALKTAISIKALLKTRKLDARMSIGIGEKTVDAQKISESNGSAFVRSGELFETLKPQKLVLAIKTGDDETDEQLNLMLRLISVLMSNWLPQSAEFVLAALQFPELSQEELGRKLNISQAAVSRRQKRAQFDLIMEIEAFYHKTIKRLDV
ncbi:sigma factor-like helix-turn-helix DNA-binding protein [Flavobacterium selenitireducens]|uniref:sigma factor-like helix-turn-helix DNA-binding protein n=1 Tax=Flavobacterium selenitireducens TaxID=2722704 RepID=UPI00168BBBBF|nr:sigma factor-like helix-turn-helix DNA-binding protein [Flavobacterium selenitireducens]MBD3581544.1 hypothetical protein [Flavobacterium selenitireducens]